MIRRIALVVALLPGLALAQGVARGGLTGSPGGGNTGIGSATNPILLTGSATNTADQVAVSIRNGVDLTCATCKILSLGGTAEKFYFSGTGLMPAAADTYSLGAAALRWSILYLGSGIYDSATVKRLSVSTGLTELVGTIADGATAVANSADTSTAYTTAGARLWQWENNNVAKAGVALDGAIALGKVATASLRAAAAGNEGELLYDDTTNSVKFSNGSAWAAVGGGSDPPSDNSTDLGTTSLRWRSLYLSGNIRDQSGARIGLGGENTANTYASGETLSDGSSVIAHTFSAPVAFSTAGAKLAQFKNGSTAKASVDAIGGFYIQPVQTVTVADDGAGTTPAHATTPTSNIVKAACNDATGCIGTISETGAQEGSVVYITHTGSGGSIVYTESSGVLEGSCTIASTDMLTALYINSAWHVQNCRDN